MADCEIKCPFCKNVNFLRKIDDCLGGRWYGHTCKTCCCKYKVFIEAVLTPKNYAIIKDGSEDKIDIWAAKKALKKGKFTNWEKVEKELGLNINEQKDKLGVK